MFGPFDYNRNNLGPMECDVLIHEKPNVYATWDNHAVYGWYFQPPPDNYRAHIYRANKTNAERMSDTVVFQHKKITKPTIKQADHIIKAIRNLEQSTKGL